MTRTIETYETSAAEYCALGGPTPEPTVEEALRRMVAIARPGGTALEVGSGPGIDADFVEALGVQVRRTDATQAFLDLQAARDRHAELLDVIADDLGGPYDAVFAMCVLIHVPRAETDLVLRKVHGALRPGGAFLVSMCDGDGEKDGNYLVTYWRQAAFAARLAAAGLVVVWQEQHVDCDGDAWLTYLARRI